MCRCQSRLYRSQAILTRGCSSSHLSTLEARLDDSTTRSGAWASTSSSPPSQTSASAPHHSSRSQNEQLLPPNSNRQDPEANLPPFDARRANPPPYTRYDVHQPPRPPMPAALPLHGPYGSGSYRQPSPDYRPDPSLSGGYASDSSHVSSASGASYASYATATSARSGFSSSASYPRAYVSPPYVVGTGASMANVCYSSHGSHHPPSASTPVRNPRACTHQSCPGSVCQSNHTYDPAAAQRFLASNYAPVPREQESWGQRRERESRNAAWRANMRMDAGGYAQYDWKDHAGPAQRHEWHQHTAECSESCAKSLDRREGVKEREWIRYGQGGGRR